VIEGRGGTGELFLQHEKNSGDASLTSHTFTKCSISPPEDLLLLQVYFFAALLLDMVFAV
jgi:hypothetical protein